MRTILLIGAGRSTASLVHYLQELSNSEQIALVIADQDEALARSRAGNHPHSTAIGFDVNNEIQRVGEISKADLVISMLPSHMHLPVARDCIALKKHMVTASYLSPDMKALDAEAKNSGVVLMNEIGLDPGIDHLSAMKTLDAIRATGAHMLQFESFAGGLVAPESDNNPWHYKFTWNPRNVVLAGQGGTVKFIQEGRYKYIPYHQLFRRTEFIDIEGYGKFEGYANRDSLMYREVYGLEDIPTIYRGTLRRPGFSRAWDVFVKLGATDDSYVMENVDNMTNRQFINSFLAYNPHDSVELKLMHYLHVDQDSDIMEKLEWLGLFEEKKIALERGTPAQILQHILEPKWHLSKDDKDMIVMYHKFGYRLGQERRQVESSMVVIGDAHPYTAMAKTVGLPVGMAARLILNGEISTPGALLPIKPEIYAPMLRELEQHGIRFYEKEGPFQS